MNNQAISFEEFMISSRISLVEQGLTLSYIK